MDEYIKLLELPDEFDLDDLKRAYKKKILKHHPDKATNEAERIKNEALTKKLNEANEYLKEYLKNNGGKYYRPIYDDINYGFDDFSESYDDFDDGMEDYFYEETVEKETFNHVKRKIFSFVKIFILILAIVVKLTDLYVHNMVVTSDVQKPEIIEQKEEQQKHDDKKKININKEKISHKIAPDVEYDEEEEETKYVPVTRDSEIFGGGY